MSSSTRPKRRCRHSVTNNLHAAAAATNESSPWASLHRDLVELIGWRVLADNLLDYVRFRAVCKNWCSMTVCPRGRGITDPRFHPRRWMMLPEGHGLHPGHGKLRGYIRFFNLSTGTIVRVRLPLFKNHCVLDSVDGILVLQRDHDTAIRLLHPFTGDIAEFPPLETLLEHVDPDMEEKRKLPSLREVCCASISVSSGGIITVMMLLSSVQTAVFANSGDQLWRVSEGLVCPRYIAQSFQGKIYKMHRPTVSGGVHILQIDPPQHQEKMHGPTEKLVATFPSSPGLYFSLVECNSEVLLFTMNRPGQPNSFYRLADLIMKRVVPFTSVGDDNTLFMGDKRLCVSAKSFPGIVGDTFVSEQRINQSRLAQYDLSRGTVSPASDGVLRWGRIRIPRPTTIIYHIYTCCYPQLWNKGLIMHQVEGSGRWRVKRKWRDGVSEPGTHASIARLICH
ncbi:hypothetical protein BS78_07G184300 [Paspalum vaginatum]|nr:hypothetical protein BS78_07G184300 [Paspalum vaginatum]